MKGIIMSETTTRKAVVTTDQVREAFASYVLGFKKIGQDITKNEFDKGLRGRGFAEYDGKGEVIRSFDTKDDALTFYGFTAKGMWAVLDTLPKPEVEVETEVKPSTRKPTVKTA
jgi:hypothetical protein